MLLSLLCVCFFFFFLVFMALFQGRPGRLVKNGLYEKHLPALFIWRREAPGTRDNPPNPRPIKFFTRQVGIQVNSANTGPSAKIFCQNLKSPITEDYALVASQIMFC